MMNDESARAETLAVILPIGESQRDSGLQPRVATQELPWVTGEKYPPNPNGVVAIGDMQFDDSIPHISFIKFDFMFAQERAKFVLKRRLPMMFLLARDVLFHLLKVGLAHREIRIAALPFKIGVVAAMFFEPAVGNPFQFLHPFRLCDGAGKTAEQMNVVFHPANDERRTVERLGHAAHVGVQGIAHRFVAQEWTAILR